MMVVYGLFGSELVSTYVLANYGYFGRTFHKRTYLLVGGLACLYEARYKCINTPNFELMLGISPSLCSVWYYFSGQ